MTYGSGDSLPRCAATIQRWPRRCAGSVLIFLSCRRRTLSALDLLAGEAPARDDRVWIRAAMSSDESQESLEYVTLDSVPWSKGHQRARMDPEERKVKHRLVQRRHMERKRERITQLQATVQILELQLKSLHAVDEAKRLTQERFALRQRFIARQQAWMVPSNPTTTEAVEEIAITEMLAAVDQLEILPLEDQTKPLQPAHQYNHP